MIVKGVGLNEDWEKTIELKSCWTLIIVSFESVFEYSINRPLINTEFTFKDKCILVLDQCTYRCLL